MSEMAKNDDGEKHTPSQLTVSELRPVEYREQTLMTYSLEGYEPRLDRGWEVARIDTGTEADATDQSLPTPHPWAVAMREAADRLESAGRMREELDKWKSLANAGINLFNAVSFHSSGTQHAKVSLAMDAAKQLCLKYAYPGGSREAILAPSPAKPHWPTPDGAGEYVGTIHNVRNYDIYDCTDIIKFIYGCTDNEWIGYSSEALTKLGGKGHWIGFAQAVSLIADFRSRQAREGEGK